MYTRNQAARLANQYTDKFGFRLYTRLRNLSHKYPDVVAPNFLSWEGETITGADTTEKVRALLDVCPQ